MSVPGGVGVRGPRDCYQPGARLDQSPCQQRALAIDVTAVGIPGSGRFFEEPKCSLGFLGCQQVQCSGLKTVHRGGGPVVVTQSGASIEVIEETASDRESLGGDPGAEGQFRDAEVLAVGVAEHKQRVVSPAEKSTKEPRLRRPATALLGHVGQGHVRNDHTLRWAEKGEDRAR